MIAPSLEIVLLHGTMGCHLLDHSNRRVWLKAGTAITDVAEHLALTPGNPALRPGPHLWPYWRATDTWRGLGLHVHPFSYDWRRSVDHAARGLDRFLRRLRAHRRGANFLLVGHSMGGVVASVWAEQTPGWDERVAGIVTLSAPLRGCMAPVSMALGQKPLALAFALFNVRDDITELRRMSITMPGMLDLMLDPHVGGAALAETFERDRWPDGIAPHQKLLDRSLELKARIAQSPALERTVAFVQLDRMTPDSVVLDDAGLLEHVAGAVPGDGTVPASSMLTPGIAAAWELKKNSLLANTHMLTPRHPDFIRAVAQLARDEAPDLPTLDLSLSWSSQRGPGDAQELAR